MGIANQERGISVGSFPAHVPTLSQTRRLADSTNPVARGIDGKTSTSAREIPLLCVGRPFLILLRNNIPHLIPTFPRRVVILGN